MKTFAVAYVSFNENDLQIKIIEANNWREALVETFIDSEETMESLPETLEEAREEASNQDWLFNVKEINNAN